jgi:2,4-dienoyl-CoA reductase-like NADH-dependent reductase (Old Yellow Enzyme family)/thioredoxin reductase
MTAALFPHLLSPLKINNLILKNRIFSTGHQTAMNVEGIPTDQMMEYLTAKARGGAALIISESSRVHSSSRQAGWVMDASDDRILNQLTRMAQSVHQHDCFIFGQLGHPGALCSRRIGGLGLEVYSASAMRDFRYQNVARPMTRKMITSVVAGYAETARRYQQAGFDGIEVMASHGVLPAQFLNPDFNQRDDDYGGSLENRMRFLVEVLTSIRETCGAGFPLGLRLSLDEKEELGLAQSDSLPVCQTLDRTDQVDYFNITGGTMLSTAAAIHVVPPMEMNAEYLRDDASSLKSLVNKPVFMAGRINQPQIAEELLRAKTIDMCGMTRAMIADPDMANKVASGRADDIVACIACNQACIGHLHQSEPISCIQTPSTGRELAKRNFTPVRSPKKVLVIGGGPAGMKAAVTARERGHNVELHEQAAQLGGQARLAQAVPERAEFGGLITNLEHQLRQYEVDVHLNSKVTRKLFDSDQYDTVLLASGAVPFLPDNESFRDAHVVHAQDVLSGEAKPGGNVVVFDWRGDWLALGAAESLASAGHGVRFATEQSNVGNSMPIYVRDMAIGRCHKLGITFSSHLRFYGAQDDSCYFTHTLSGEPVEWENVDSVVLSTGHSPNDELEHDLLIGSQPYHLIGDCLMPRSAEEAIYEGWVAGMSIC